MAEDSLTTALFDAGVQIEQARRAQFRQLRMLSRRLPFSVLFGPILRYARKGKCPRTGEGELDPTSILREYELAAQGKRKRDRRSLNPARVWDRDRLCFLAARSEGLATALRRKRWRKWPPRGRRAFFEDSLREAGFPSYQLHGLVEMLEKSLPTRPRHKRSADAATAESWRMMCAYWAKRIDESLARGESLASLLEGLSAAERAEYQLLRVSKGTAHVGLKASTVQEARLGAKLLAEWQTTLELPRVRRRVFRAFVLRVRRVPTARQGRFLAMMLYFTLSPRAESLGSTQVD